MLGFKPASAARLPFNSKTCSISNKAVATHEEEEPEEIDIETFTNYVLLKHKPNASETNTSSKVSIPNGNKTVDNQEKNISTRQRNPLPTGKIFQPKPFKEILPNSVKNILLQVKKPVDAPPNSQSSLKIQPDDSSSTSDNLTCETTETPLPSKVISSVSVRTTPSPTVSHHVDTLDDMNLYNEQLNLNLEINNSQMNNFNGPLWKTSSSRPRLMESPNVMSTKPVATDKLHSLSEARTVAWFLKRMSTSQQRFQDEVRMKLLEQLRVYLQDYNKCVSEMQLFSSQSKKKQIEVAKGGCSQKKMTLLPPSFSPAPKNSKNERSGKQTQKKNSSKKPNCLETQFRGNTSSKNDILHSTQQRLQSADHRPVLQVAVIGPPNSGKSSLVGLLLYLSGVIDEGDYGKVCWELEKYRNQLQSKKALKHDMKKRLLGLEVDENHWGQLTSLSWIVDRLAEERERGQTWQTCYKSFCTKKWRVNIIDTPSREDRLNERVSALCHADVALIVVNTSHYSTSTSSDESNLPTGIIDPIDISVKEQIWTAHSLGISSFVLALVSSDASVTPASRVLAHWEKYITDIVSNISVYLTKCSAQNIEISIKAYWIGNLWKDESHLSSSYYEELYIRMGNMISYLDDLSAESLKLSANANVRSEAPLFLVDDVFKPFNSSGWCVSGHLLQGSLFLSSGNSQQIRLFSIDNANSTDKSNYPALLLRGLSRARAPGYGNVNKDGNDLLKCKSNLVEGDESITAAYPGEYICLNVIPDVEQISTPTSDNQPTSGQFKPPLGLDHSVSSRTILLTSNPDHLIISPSHLSINPTNSRQYIYVILTQVFSAHNFHKDMEWVCLCSGEIVSIHSHSSSCPAIVKRVCRSTSSGFRYSNRLVCGSYIEKNEVEEVILILGCISSSSMPTLRLQEDTTDRLKLNRIILTNRKGQLIAGGKMTLHLNVDHPIKRK